VPKIDAEEGSNPKRGDPSTEEETELVAVRIVCGVSVFVGGVFNTLLRGGCDGRRDGDVVDVGGEYCDCVSLYVSGDGEDIQMISVNQKTLADWWVEFGAFEWPSCFEIPAAIELKYGDDPLAMEKGTSGAWAVLDLLLTQAEKNAAHARRKATKTLDGISKLGGTREKEVTQGEMLNKIQISIDNIKAKYRPADPNFIEVMQELWKATKWLEDLKDIEKFRRHQQ